MSTAVHQTITITAGEEISDKELDRIIELFDSTGLNVVVEPTTRRMGPASDLIGIIISAPLEWLVGAFMGAMGKKLWTAIATATRNRRGQLAPPDDNEQPLLTLFDSTAHIRVDLTASDLADDRLPNELCQLRDAKEIVVHWDQSSGRWVALPSDPENETGQ